MTKRKPAGVLIVAVLLTGVLSWMFTAPYLGNEGLARTPGVIIGGTATPPLDDFTPLNERFPGPIRMKQTGFTLRGGRASAQLGGFFWKPR
jgi:hypothetical protein